ncbi:YveK family protein [Blastococcus brunescens]|uniref:Wzz/FepE/Etk N-terminal domain-containing protein n=1 Tax=Blastococcus brunescens TaxID=1564165 RepID=A0ABZ1B1N0_9ACTN|nr:Wzz/FepE/Etk N-terminal domain-containing protein [Blastococcus sp. BMG 8361]WRL64725.1 Wzz/FepE/Etk N-terminal domain-containing protein [Blastococcus sp. BMG 8361]
MELRDYLAALGRYWRTWVGLTAIGLLVAVVAIQVSPRTYSATAGVFVASSLEGTSGSQFVNQRVRSYPEIAQSLAVLSPVIEELGLEMPFRDLRATVTASNPVETSQIDISVTSASPQLAADIANAVAEEFGQVVESLEAPADGRSPVSLTVTDPATVPASPASPDPVLLLALGLVVGLSLGLAVAITRSRMSPALHTEDDVRGAWGGGADVSVHAPRAGRSRHEPDTPAAALIRQLETLAERGTVRLLAVSPTSGQEAALARLLADVANELSARGVPAVVVGDPAEAPDGADRDARVRLTVAAPVVALRDWRRIAGGQDGLLIVAQAGRVTAGQLGELQAMTSAVDLSPVALVLLRSWSRQVRRAAAPTTRARSTRPGSGFPAGGHRVRPDDGAGAARSVQDAGHHRHRARPGPAQASLRAPLGPQGSAGPAARMAAGSSPGVLQPCSGPRAGAARTWGSAVRPGCSPPRTLAQWAVRRASTRRRRRRARRTARVVTRPRPAARPRAAGGTPASRRRARSPARCG